MKGVTTKKLVLTALLMALTAVSTMFIRVPLPLGYVNLGDAFVLLSVFILGPIYGTIAAGVGSALADLLGYIIYAPGTLIIKTAMALVAYLFYKLLLKATKKAVLAEIVGGVAGAVIMAFGYFFYETLFFETAAVAIVNVPWNLIQGAIGVIISTTVMRILFATKIINKLQD
ncbi:MAG: ECF transporter S component [Clostridia bacterium]|nr:ECF transporter S component [Clostridia bacterium]